MKPVVLGEDGEPVEAPAQALSTDATSRAA
jgi:hypothetical protein